MKLSFLSERMNGILEGDGNVEISGVAGIQSATSGDISFLSNPKYMSNAVCTAASAVIVSEDWEGECPAALIRVKNPDAAFAEITSLFYTPPPSPSVGTHPSAIIAEDVELGEDVSIGPLCVIESGVKIGAKTILMAGCYIGYGSLIGANCCFYPKVSLREFVQIGQRVILHNGAVIGSDGFGYSVNGKGVRTKIQQTGIVEIGDDVEIGANVTVDRARFGKTKIGNGVKIDNLVQIGHNVVIGEHAVLVSQVGIAGSSSVGKRSILAGQVGVSGHLKIGDNAIIGPQAGVTKDIPDRAHVLGMPAIPIEKMKRNHAAITRLPKLKERFCVLEKKMEEQFPVRKK